MTLSQDLGPATNAVSWIFASIALSTVALRLYLRLGKRENAGWDDLIIAIAGALDFVASVMLSVAVKYGTGKHVTDIQPSDLPKAAHMNLVATALLIMNIVVPKLSVALLLVRLLSPRRLVAALLISLALLGVVFGLLVVAVTFAQCTPMAGAWNPIKYHPTCWNPKILTDLSFLGGVYACFLDFAFAIYPATVFWTLQMNIQKKIGISALMSLGVIAGAVGIEKNTKIPLLGRREDLTYTSAQVLLWSQVEANCCILAACIPTLRPYTTMVKLPNTSIRSWFSRGSSQESSYKRCSHKGTESGDKIELVPQRPGEISRKTEITVNNDARTGSKTSVVNDQYASYMLPNV